MTKESLQQNRIKAARNFNNKNKPFKKYLQEEKTKYYIHLKTLYALSHLSSVLLFETL